MKVYKRRDFPTDYADAQHNLGTALSDLVEISQQEEKKRLVEEAKACYLEALSVYTEKHFPHEHKGVKGNLESLERMEKELGAPE